MKGNSVGARQPLNWNVNQIPQKDVALTRGTPGIEANEETKQNLILDRDPMLHLHYLRTFGRCGSEETSGGAHAP